MILVKSPRQQTYNLQMTARTIPFLLVTAVALISAEAMITPVPEKVSGTIKDRQDLQIPDRVRLTGWKGLRSAASITNRLEQVDLDRLVDGFRHRPGRHPWDGEHVGKWLHAATLEWVNSGDPVLRMKMDYVAIELAKCQTTDGYLGTYVDQKRWTSWDVWVHKYNLIGLISYVRYTGNTNHLSTCVRMADLLCATFGDNPGKRDIIKSGEHVGMAPTSVLEPMVLLYRLTGEARYLDFCKYILRSWEQPNGPHIISRLLNEKRVDKVGNGKAYEMLSCLNGALEYYRTTGDPKILTACLNAWQDIVDKRIYLTGAMSYREHFHGDFDLPNVRNVGETCVTVTWLQFNAQLLRLTGEARFADQLERVILNQLFGAQLFDGSGWGYYVQMEGKKPYYKGDDRGVPGSGFTCCLSSGPRGLALIPAFAMTTDAEGVVVNLYESGHARLQLRSGDLVEVDTDTLYPGEDRIRFTLSATTTKSFAVKLRVPAWCRKVSITVDGKAVKTSPERDGYVKLKRNWKPGAKIELNLKQEAHLIVGDHNNKDRVAVLFGPLVLAADAGLLQVDGQTLNSYSIAKPNVAALRLAPESAPVGVKTWPGARVFRIDAVRRPEGFPTSVRLMPFADAGGNGSDYQIWLPLPGYVAPIAPPMIALPPLQPATLAPKGTAVRINAGSRTNFTDGAGNIWLSDRGFIDGELSVREADLKIENTTVAEIYRSEHWGMSSFSHPVHDGLYAVKLHFAETWDGVVGPEGRVFSFNVEGRVYKDFDIWAKAGGPRRAYVEALNVNIVDGNLDIVFESGVDNPAINAIEIIPTQ
jgi:DUF1680 family protein